MTTKRIHRSVLLLAFGVLLAPAAGHAFTGLQRSTITATASVGAPLTINIPAVAPQVFYGKDMVVAPIEIISPTQLNLSTVSASMIYQLYDAGNNFIGTPQTVQIPLQSVPGNPKAAQGAAVVPVAGPYGLQALRNGGTIQYYFLIQAGSQQIFVRSQQLPFAVQFVNTMSFPVSPSGSNAVVPDPYLPDGKTAIAFPPGALSNPGTLVVTQLQPSALPTGPLNLPPFLAYEMDLQGTTLLTEARLTMTYPSSPNGSLQNLDGTSANGTPQDLAPYWLWTPTQWTILSVPQLDTVQHTLAATTTHFSTFALFVSGFTGAADLRPAQRIITPNGDGINDTVYFGGVTGSDEVKIFDVRGRRVRTMAGPQPTWDGRDDNGRIVESGVYVYQYTSNGTRVSGVIVVAK